jgi:hypothetical protein
MVVCGLAETLLLGDAGGAGRSGCSAATYLLDFRGLGRDQLHELVDAWRISSPVMPRAVVQVLVLAARRDVRACTARRGLLHRVGHAASVSETCLPEGRVAGIPRR